MYKVNDKIYNPLYGLMVVKYKDDDPTKELIAVPINGGESLPIDDVEVDAKITQVVNAYLETHPIDGVSQEDIENAVSSYMANHPIDTITEDEVSQIVADYMSNHPIDTLTESEVNSLISEYMTEHPIHDGLDGFSARLPQGEYNPSDYLVVDDGTTAKKISVDEFIEGAKENIYGTPTKRYFPKGIVFNYSLKNIVTIVDNDLSLDYIVFNGTVASQGSITIGSAITINHPFKLISLCDTNFTQNQLRWIISKRLRGTTDSYSWFNNISVDNTTLNVSKEDALKYEFSITLQVNLSNEPFDTDNVVITPLIQIESVGADTNKVLTEKVNALENKTNDSKLSAPNGNKYILQIDNEGNLQVISQIPSNILYIGNSLLIGFGSHGMASTNVQDDYYYKINHWITAQGKTLDVADKLAGRAFEDCTTDEMVNEWLATSLAPQMNSDRQLVIVQLGDNVNNGEKLAEFDRSCGMLLHYIREHCPNSRVCWVGMWYASEAKMEIVKKACKKYGCFLVDIHDLLESELYRNHIGATYIDSNGNEQTITESGVASHPNDLGFTKIAKRVVEQLFDGEYSE